MEKSLLGEIKKNAMILTGICALAVLFLYVIGQFTELHPDAYRDLIRSILFGYGIYLFIYSFYHIVLKRKSARSLFRKKTSKSIKEAPLDSICEVFLVITVLNSLMMLTGIDTPKEGTFAYIHMMTRLFIISGIIVIFMWKEVMGGLKIFNFNNKFKYFYREAHKNIFKSVAIMFTFITAVYCLIMIAFQSIINPGGGSFFYQSLLGILVFVTIGMFTFRISRKSA